METTASNGFIEVPLGATIGIIYNSKTGVNRTASIVNGPIKNRYIAIFEEDDVDFKIAVNNLNANRDFNFNLDFFGNYYPFVVGYQENCGLKTPHSGGQHFHFFSINNKKSHNWVNTVAGFYQTSCDEAVNIIDNLRFIVRYSMPKEMDTIEMNDVDDKLEISIFSMELFEPQPSRSVLLRRDAIIADVRREINAKYHQTLTKQFVLYAGDGETLLKYAGTLASYQLENQDHIYIKYAATMPAHSFPIKCRKLARVPFEMSVTSDTTIKQLTEQLNQHYGPFMLDTNYFRLYCENRELFDHFTLEDYGIHLQPEPFLHIRFNTFQLFVKTLTGQTILITCTSKDTVRMVKEEIAAQESISVDDQRLIFAGQQLLDKVHLFYYQLGPNSTVHLVVRIRGGEQKAGTGGKSISNKLERGIMTFGKNANQTFKRCRFLPDSTANIEPFVIELKLKTSNQ